MVSLLTFDGIVGALQEMDLTDEQKDQVVQALECETWQGIEIKEPAQFRESWVAALAFTQYTIERLGYPRMAVPFESVVELLSKLIP